MYGTCSCVANYSCTKEKSINFLHTISLSLSLSLYIYIYHHHHDVRLARISLTLSLHVSLSFIASGRSSGLHPVSSHSCCMYVRAFDWPYAGVHRSTSLTISSLLLQQCPACLVRLACIIFVIGGWWPYSWRLVGCYCQHLFKDSFISSGIDSQLVIRKSEIPDKIISTDVHKSVRLLGHTT